MGNAASRAIRLFICLTDGSVPAPISRRLAIAEACMTRNQKVFIPCPKILRHVSLLPRTMAPTPDIKWGDHRWATRRTGIYIHGGRR